MIKMQSITILAACSVASVSDPHAPTAHRKRPVAALRNLRTRHSPIGKAAPSRIAPTRPRLQMRGMQPDRVDRTGSAGRRGPGLNPGRISTVSAGALKNPHPAANPPTGDSRTSARCVCSPAAFFHPVLSTSRMHLHHRTSVACVDGLTVHRENIAQRLV